MRHSDIKLTLGIYTHTLGGQDSKAIENLPDLSVNKDKKTGTSDWICLRK